jgi:hypothetical protein
MAHDHPDRASLDIDLHTASLARVYDYMLGGAHNFAVDREVADRIEAAAPGSARAAWSNRAFLRRAVRYCAERGIDQFLDVGSGIPTEGTVHEIARAVDPDSRVVYVDVDPVAVLQSRAILEGDKLSGVVNADLRHPERILADPVTTRLIDPGRPVAVLMVALLHVIPDDADPAGLVARLTGPLSAGSHLVVSHFSSNFGSPEQVSRAIECSRDTGTPLVIREPRAIRALLGTFEPVPPGLVPVDDWRPREDEPGGRSGGYAVVARRT